MRISVLGLGYVGLVSAACLAQMRHQVTGFDTDSLKLASIANETISLAEKNLKPLLNKALHNNTLRIAETIAEAIAQSDISLICVGTPAKPTGEIDLSHIEAVCETVGKALANLNHFHVVVIRSTLLPFSMQNHVIPILEQHSGKKAGVDFGVCHQPEFLREGNAVEDFMQPARTIIGTEDERAGQLVAALYEDLPAPVFFTSLKEAEMLKYVDNSWHALKVAFGNEIGKFCKHQAMDSHRVMELFCADTRLNISNAYLKPAFAFGGSCLPKDVTALNSRLQQLGLESPLLESLMVSNQSHIDHTIALIEAQGKQNIGFLGLSFKEGTDDVRASPILQVIRHLGKKDYRIKAFDPYINQHTLQQAQETAIIPYLCDTITDILPGSDVIVIANKDTLFSDITIHLKPEQIVIDLVRLPDIEQNHTNYHGICW